jgi:hypothetical protein
MTKKHSIFNLVAFVAILLVLLATLGYWRAQRDATTPPVTSIETDDLIVGGSYETKIISEGSDYVTINAKYPYFPQASAEFNTQVETVVKKVITDQKESAEDNWKARYETRVPGEDITAKPATEEDKWPLMADFTTVQSNANYISYVFEYSGYSGGAHGYANKVSFAYDVKNDKILTLKDLFPNDPNYLKTVSDASRADLKKQYVVMNDEEDTSTLVSMIEDGTQPKEENFSVFTFTPTTITLYFGQYQVGPYVLGMPEVELSR